jgi:hypothetical protein
LFQNPQKDIPLGTFIAIGISSVSYIAVVWLLGSCIVRDATGPLVAMVIDTVNTTSTTEIPSLINSTMSTVIAKLPYTFHNVQNCSLAEAGECKYGLIHDYQVRTVLLLITYNYQLSVELRIWIENLSKLSDIVDIE